MIWGWPQFVYAGIMMVGIGMHIAKHGEPKNDKYNMFWQLFGTVVGSWILYEGGFWS